MKRQKEERERRKEKERKESGERLGTGKGIFHGSSHKVLGGAGAVVHAGKF